MKKILALIDFDQTLTEVDMLSLACDIVWKTEESKALDEAYQNWELQWIEWLIQNINLLSWVSVSDLQERIRNEKCLRPWVVEFFKYLRWCNATIAICSWNITSIIEIYKNELQYDYLFCSRCEIVDWVLLWTNSEICGWSDHKVRSSKKLITELWMTNDDIILSLGDSRSDIGIFWLADYTIAISPRWWLREVADDIVETDFFEVKKLVERYLNNH